MCVCVRGEARTLPHPHEGILESTDKMLTGDLKTERQKERKKERKKKSKVWTNRYFKSDFITKKLKSRTCKHAHTHKNLHFWFFFHVHSSVSRQSTFSDTSCCSRASVRGCNLHHKNNQLMHKHTFL